ncbi:hypothetical protein JCM8097_006569 [Rhodosporidiobolus ruineniae]
MSTAARPLDRLSRLPAELIDRIFLFAYTYDQVKTTIPFCNPRYKRKVTTRKRSPPRGPISAFLLPFQRHRYASLCLKQATDETYHRKLLPLCTGLESLTVDPALDLPALLALLPNPNRLRSLTIRQYKSKSGGVTPELAPALAGLASLEVLSLYCPFDFTEPIRQALSNTKLKSLHLGEDAETSPWDANEYGVVGAHVLALVETVSTLKTLEVNLVYGRHGGTAEDNDYKYNYFTKSWQLPEWTEDFGEEDVQKIVEAGKARGIKVYGCAVDAIGLGDEYEEELEKVDRGPPRQKFRWDDEDSDEDEDDGW